MTTYRVRCNIYRIDAANPEQAKKDACEILKRMPEKFITVEVMTDYRPLWKKLLFGPR